MQRRLRKRGRRLSQRASRIKLNADSAVPMVSTDGFGHSARPRVAVKTEWLRWYGLLIDIDDRKKARENLRRTQARLSRAITDCHGWRPAAAIAHEINQPLAASRKGTVGPACSWLAAVPPGMAKAQEAAERIVRDGRRRRGGAAHPGASFN